MCESKSDQERRTLFEGIGDIVEEMNQTVRTTVEKGKVDPIIKTARGPN